MWMQINANSPARQIAFSPDGQNIEWMSPDGCRVAAAKSGNNLPFKSEPFTMAFCYSRNGSRRVIGNEWGIEVRNVRSTDQLQLADNSIPTGGKPERVVCLNSPATRLAWVNAANPRRLMIFSTLGLGQDSVPSDSGITALVSHPESEWLAFGQADGNIGLWHDDLTTTVLRGHNKRITALAFSADGKRLASASTDGTIRIWDVESGVELAAIGDLDDREAPTALAFSPKGNLLAAGIGRKVMVFGTAE